MKRNKAAGIAIIFTLIGLVTGLVLTSNLNLQTKAYAGDGISKEAIDILSKTGEAMAEVAAAIRPGVVNISTTKKVRMRGLERSPFFDDPVFRRFFGDEFFHQFREPREEKTMSLGSGVIVDKAGYILTNYHVIKDADEIKVTLSDKREFIGAVKGADSKTDLALIKIDTDSLPVLKWGDSDKLRIGETVIAVGSPYGLSQTITSGIVSAKGRANVGITDYEDFIQTDAAINPGNSGGALVNIRGELIGINTAIFSTSGGYQGIGFAIPSNMAKTVLDTLVKKGKVIRGWIGVWIQPVTKDIAKQFNLKDEAGALVSDVFEGSPAEKAGLQRGDIVREYDGNKIEEPTSLRNMAAATPPGKEVELKIIRDGKEERSLRLVAAEQPEAEETVQTGAYENIFKGVSVMDITPELRRGLRIPGRISGVLVSQVAQGSPAGEKGLMKGDVMLEINRAKIGSVNDYSNVVSKLPAEGDVLVLLYRNNRVFYVILSP